MEKQRRGMQPREADALPEPRIYNMSFLDDGSIQIDWVDDSEKIEYGTTAFSTVVGPKALAEWTQVGYYAKEVISDSYELLHWYTQHKDGKVR